MGISSNKVWLGEGYHISPKNQHERLRQFVNRMWTVIARKLVIPTLHSIMAVRVDETLNQERECETDFGA